MAFNLNFDFTETSARESEPKENRQTIPIQVVNWNERYLTGVFDSVLADGRLHISQEVKDHLILQNWNLIETQGLELQYHNSFWFHGPFDTNLMLSSDSSGLFEYDGLLLKWNLNGSEIYKSTTSNAESDFYSSAWTNPVKGRVSMGTSWFARGLNLLNRIETETSFENENVHQVFRRACGHISGLSQSNILKERTKESLVFE